MASRGRMGLLVGLAGLALLGGCVAPVGPVAVTRFHVAGYSGAARGLIAVMAAPGMAAGSPELRSWQEAVAAELARAGYRVLAAGDAGEPAEIAEVRVERAEPAPADQPVRVGLHGAAGSFGSGLGVGVAIPLGRSRPPVTTTLAVRIRDARGGQALWEGRASFSVAATSPLAGNQLGAAKLAAALFAGFPGHSGETISVP